MKLGVFSVSMPEYDLQETVDILKKIGYDGVEWRVQTIPEKKPENVVYETRYWSWNRSTVDIATIEETAGPIRKMCDEAGLEIFGFTTYLRPDQTEALKPVLRAAQSAGVKRVRVFTPSFTYAEDQESYPELVKKTRKNIGTIEQLAKEHGVKVVFEIHHDNIFSSASAAIRLLEGFDPQYIGIIVDPGNMVYEGYENYRKVFQILGSYVDHIHIKNAKMAPGERDELGAVKWERVWAPLKEGTADLRQFIHELKQTGYDGTISVEDFNNEMPTLEKLQYCYDYIHELWEKA